MNLSTGSVLHNAPRVSYLVGRSPFYAGLLLTVWLTGAGLLLAWTVQSDSLNLRHGVVAWLLVILSVFAAWSWHQSVQGVLSWDGQNWTWTFHPAAEPTGVQLECHLDLQTHVLLHVRSLNGSFARWVWWSQRQNPARWMDARRALFARARQVAPKAADQVGLLS